MSEHTWLPVEGDKDAFSLRQIVYRNELGEEYVHVFDNFFYFDDPRAACWKGCSGDWPGCKMTCSVYAMIAEEMRAQQKEYETMPPPDPFSFMLNHTAELDVRTFYVEQFDTLDGAHWEIALDIRKQIEDILDREGAE